MAHAKDKKSLLLLGVHLASEGYPNTLYRLQDLRASDDFRVSEINVPMWHAPQSTNQKTGKGLLRTSRSLMRAMFAHAAVLCKFFISKKPDCVYIPYPAPFLLFFLSWLPRVLCPRRVIADVFISLYDTIVNDRRLLKENSLLARLLKSVERRAYQYADTLIVDTPQNAQFLSTLFELPIEKIKAIPLSTDEIHFQNTPYQPKSETCRVLFIGTMVPLHGIDTLLQAATLLSNRCNIQFKLIGDGQDAHLVEAWMQGKHANLSWERKWQSSKILAQEISQADICLGIFGAGDKTQRVCPFKIYAYAAIGRAIITGETAWSNSALVDLRAPPFATIPVNNAQALALKISELADKKELRTILAENSRKFYSANLSNHKAMNELSDCVLGD